MSNFLLISTSLFRERVVPVEQDCILSAENLCKSFRHVKALRGVSLQARRGQITAIVGDNGSGKTTLIKILSGNLRPDSGKICIENHSFPRLTVCQALGLGIRTVYQDLSLDNMKNSAENIFLGQEYRKGPFLDRKRMLREAAALLEEIHVQIPDLTEPVGNLSGGQRQGVAIARALRNSGSILLLDEPTAAMGIQESHSALNILRMLRDRGMTQIIISHNLHQVFSLADHIYVMRSGEVIASVDTRDSSVSQLQELILSQEAIRG